MRILAILLLSTPAAAAVFRATSVEEIALGAETIVRGRVEAPSNPRSCAYQRPGTSGRNRGVSAGAPP